MRKILRYCLAFVLSFVFSIHVYSQKEVNVEINYAYVAPTYLTYDQMIENAINAAKIQAIADEFGTIITRQSTYDVTPETQQFKSFSMSDVRGEWIKTEGKPEVKYEFSEVGPVFFVHLKGKIRELNYLKPQFRSEFLKMPPSKTSLNAIETDEFRNGDAMCLAFTAPCDGYLSIFSKDNDSIRCFLPQLDVTTGLLPVKANRRNTFYDSPYDYLEMQTVNPVELSAYYVLFSPNPINRPMAHVIDDYGTPVYTDEEFHRWLAQLYAKDKKLQVEVKYITIRK